MGCSLEEQPSIVPKPIEDGRLKMVVQSVPNAVAAGLSTGKRCFMERKWEIFAWAPESWHFDWPIRGPIR
jgi:hypothetical protein